MIGSSRNQWKPAPVTEMILVSLVSMERVRPFKYCGGNVP
jgi:hypothetical protein